MGVNIWGWLSNKGIIYIFKFFYGGRGGFGPYYCPVFRKILSPHHGWRYLFLSVSDQLNTECLGRWLEQLIFHATACVVGGGLRQSVHWSAVKPGLMIIVYLSIRFSSWLSKEGNRSMTKTCKNPWRHT
jgi:hypothetical protein